MKHLKEALFSRKNLGISDIDKILVANCFNAISASEGKFERYLGTPLQDLYSYDELCNEIRKKIYKDRNRRLYFYVLL